MIMKKIQRFGGAMFTPVLLFAFSGIAVAIALVMKNPSIVGSVATEGTNWFKFFTVIEEGAWTVFRQMPLIFAIALPIGLANKAQARACMESLVVYITFNYYINALLTNYNFGVDITAPISSTSGLTYIAGVKTLDTNIIGAIIISSIVVYLHNKYFDTKLPEFLGIFQGSTFVYILGFILMLPIALITVLVWPKVQLGILSLQVLLVKSGSIGVFIYTLLERLLIPTGLHHFIYGPFVFGPAVVENGIVSTWAQNLQSFANSTLPLKELFPAGGFALHGNSKIFGSIGIALAIYSTARKENKKIVLALLIPVVLTAVVSGITEPLEFTFLFIAPLLFVVHSILAAFLATIMFMFGVVGNMGGGLLEIATLNWIPMFKNHKETVIIQIVIGLIFTVIYYFVFRFLILKLNILTPGREEANNEVKMYTKADYKEKQNSKDDKAKKFLEALGGKDNIEELNNCATRLRVSVKDKEKVAGDDVFKQIGAHGVVRNGNAIQVIIGLHVQSIKSEIELLREQ